MTLQCRQQRLLLQLTAAACRRESRRRQPLTRTVSRCSAIPQEQPSPRRSHHHHNFSTSSRRHQQPPPHYPFPTYFQDAPPPPPPPPPPAPKPKRSVLRRVLFATSFFVIGNLAGTVLDMFINPSPPVPKDSRTDQLQRDKIHDRASKLDVVQALEEDPTWISWDAYTSFPPEQKQTHIVASSLSSSSALGAYQRVFQNTETGEVLVLIYFGRGVTGWPTVVHGGVLATVLDETCGRAAFSRLGLADGEKERPVLTARLKLDYLAMTQEREFYLVGARVKEEEELEAGERGKSDYKAHVQGWVESVRTGEETVVAEALFVGAKPMKREKAGVEAEVKAGGPPLLPPDKRW